VQEKRVRIKSEEKRKQIIDAAGALFISSGFEKVSMDDRQISRRIQTDDLQSLRQ
jgi:AcrR family transcriptional regulator